MKTKLVLIIGLLSMQPLFGVSLSPQDLKNLQAPTADKLSAAIATAKTRNSKSATDQQAIKDAETRLAAMQGAPAQQPPVSTGTPVSTGSAAGAGSGAAVGPVTTQAGNVMQMREFQDAQTAARNVRTALQNAKVPDVEAVMKQIIAP